jgi:1A family penicillin-binding protein
VWKKVFVVVWPLLIALLFIAVITTLIFIGALGNKESLINRNHTGVTLLDRNGKVFYQFGNARTDTYVALSAIAPVAQKAVVSSEDKDFYRHPGFSITGIGSALYQNLIRRGDGGGSTLTQQLVKNALLSPKRDLLRKYQEFILSVEIERRYTKAEILEMYLNSAYFGEGAFGIEDAAKVYFGKAAKDLDLAEASMLIGLLPAPTTYSPISGDAHKAKVRQAYVLDRMQKDGNITAEAVASAGAEVLRYQPKAPEQPPKSPHFALMVKDWLQKQYGEEQITRSGYTVKTTLNPEYQALAEAAVQAQVKRLAASKVSNGSAVIVDPRNGEVMAVVGSVDWNNSQFGKVNMATSSRQPGSSFKPFVYATGIEDKLMSAATIFEDKPKDFSGYKPKNYDLSYHGNVTLRRALANSLNIPAVEAMQKVGIDNVIKNARAVGLTTLDKTADEYGLPLALGSGQARLIEMTNGYAAFANQGKHYDTQLVMSITDKNNHQIYTESSQSSTVWSPGTAFVMSSILSDNSARSEVFGGSLTVAGSRPVAVKTGTTEDYRDAWTIGYTPSLAIGVWIGNNDNSPMSSIAGASGAAPIWRSLMQRILSGGQVEKFVQPASITSHDVCSDGALAMNPGDNTYTEYFLTGTLPSATCNESKPEVPQAAPVLTPDTQAPKTDTKPVTTPAVVPTPATTTPVTPSTTTPSSNPSTPSSTTPPTTPTGTTPATTPTTAPTTTTPVTTPPPATTTPTPPAGQ